MKKKPSLVLLSTAVPELHLDHETIAFKTPYPYLLYDTTKKHFYVTFPMSKVTKKRFSGIPAKTRNLFEAFTGQTGNKMLKFKMAVPEKPRFIGKLLAITYKSYKECTRPNLKECRLITYIHETNPNGRPKVFMTSCGLTYLIKDGSLCIKTIDGLSWLEG